MDIAPSFVITRDGAYINLSERRKVDLSTNGYGLLNQTNDQGAWCSNRFNIVAKYCAACWGGVAFNLSAKAVVLNRKKLTLLDKIHQTNMRQYKAAVCRFHTDDFVSFQA